jgi:hypothetical protein
MKTLFLRRLRILILVSFFNLIEYFSNFNIFHKFLFIDKIMYTLKENGLYKGLFYILFFNMSVHLTKVLGLAPGGEFRRALAEVKISFNISPLHYLYLLFYIS